MIKPATKPLTVRRQNCTLDIWESTETLRIYPDRTIHRHPCRRYENSNSWGLGETAERYTGQMHQKLIRLLEEESADGEDYTDRLFEAVNCYY